MLQTFSLTLYQLQLILSWSLQALLMVLDCRNWLFNLGVRRRVEIPQRFCLLPDTGKLMLEGTLVLDKLTAQLFEHVLHMRELKLLFFFDQLLLLLKVLYLLGHLFESLLVTL